MGKEQYCRVFQYDGSYGVWVGEDKSVSLVCHSKDEVIDFLTDHLNDIKGTRDYSEIENLEVEYVGEKEISRHILEIALGENRTTNPHLFSHRRIATVAAKLILKKEAEITALKRDLNMLNGPEPELKPGRILDPLTVSVELIPGSMTVKLPAFQVAWKIAEKKKFQGEYDIIDCAEDGYKLAQSLLAVGQGQPQPDKELPFTTDLADAPDWPEAILKTFEKGEGHDKA